MPARRIQCEQPIHQFVAGAKVSPPKTIEGNTQICEAVLRSIGENAQCPQDREAESLRLRAGRSVINQERVGRKFRRQCDRVRFTKTEKDRTRQEWLTRRANVQPIRLVRQPLADGIRRTLLVQFSDDSRWDGHASIQGRQYVYV